MDFRGNEIIYDEYEVNKAIRKVILFMVFGVLLTFGTMAYGAFYNQNLIAFVYSNYYPIIIGEFAIVIALSWAKKFLSPFLMGIGFFLYSFLTGLTLSGIGLIYDFSAILYALASTLIIFVVMAVFGYTTKENLLGYGKMLMVGLISLILVSLLNLWLASPVLYWIITYAGVAIFTALIGYDMQKIKHNLIVRSGGDSVEVNKIAILGALELYLDFINLFLYLLRIFGKKR
ncbi:MAG: Bax inhibitor-1/YccA family protein [Fusobacteriaceae bacterium]|jgi:FtsH-binding integral membrane protein|nr:Bax inhibitor-1/YccA family protein [Fusobacteriaceae bacterium]MBN2838332.1 Bax inhibitor-1/YccA family protein [Fusobacteriaceae bacterium]